MRLGETARAKKYTGIKKKEKGKRRCSQVDLENIGMRKISKVTNSRAVKPSTGTFLLYLTMSFITAIGTANPRHKYPQSGLADFMVRAMKLPYEEERKLRAIFTLIVPLSEEGTPQTKA